MKHMTIDEVTELAKQGGKLASDQQWVLADQLTLLSEQGLITVALNSNRNEDTLRQYQRAAERWDPSDRVDGVSFSAHRVALSHHSPKELLEDLKAEHGSPTVKQVRRAMGLEGHPAIEHLRKGVSKIDNAIDVVKLRELAKRMNEVSVLIEEEQELAKQRAITSSTSSVEPVSVEPEPEPEPEPVPVEEPEETEVWEPKVRVSDISNY